MLLRFPVGKDIQSARECKILWDTTNPAGYANRMGLYRTKIEYEFIRAHFPPAPARVLDIAGGCGRFANKLLDDGYDVVVNDKDARSLNVLRARCLKPTPKTFPGDFLSIDLTERFDCALAIECLEHMPFQQAIARIRTLLKQGGILVFTVLNSGSWRFAARRILGRAMNVEYVMKAQHYLETCAASGFDIVALRGLMWMPVLVNSNSFLVPLFGTLERRLQLFSAQSQSPWLLIAARRSD